MFGFVFHYWEMCVKALVKLSRKLAVAKGRAFGRLSQQSLRKAFTKKASDGKSRPRRISAVPLGLITRVLNSGQTKSGIRGGVP
jgi:hypothetical protein